MPAIQFRTGVGRGAHRLLLNPPVISSEKIRLYFVPGPYVQRCPVKDIPYFHILPAITTLKKYYQGGAIYNGKNMTLQKWGTVYLNCQRGVVPIFPVSALYSGGLAVKQVFKKMVSRQIPLIFYADVPYILHTHFTRNLAACVGVTQEKMRCYLSGSLQYFLYSNISDYSHLQRWGVSPLLHKFKVV